jgi:DNA replication and repair protein RecF
MRIVWMSGKHFRNLGEDVLRLHPRFNVLVGSNAQGKTNALELAHTLAELKSFRTTRHGEMVAHGYPEAALFGEVERLGVERHVRVLLGDRSRRVWVNDQLFRRLADYLGLFQAVLFSPEDVSLLKGAPAERRRWLDRAVFNSRAAYLEDLNLYQEAVRQRNALLDEGKGGPLLEVYDEQVCGYGARVLWARLTYLGEWVTRFREAFGCIFGKNLDLSVRYDASWSSDGALLGGQWPQEALRGMLWEAMRAGRRDEQRRRKCLFGPHRDDVTVVLGGQEAKATASQGQHRALVLALKISEINLLRDRFGVEPLLLLDDVSSELDKERNGQLFDFLSQFTGQVLITTTDRAHVPIQRDVRVWRVDAGALTCVEGE